jgi:hypothetical protein
MEKIRVDPQFLEDFEKGFNPRHPDRSTTPATVLGYGEISTILEILSKDMHGLACKRMPMFENEEEAENYLRVYQAYLDVLENKVGLNLVPSETLWISDEEHGRVIFYILQEKVPPGTIGHQAIHLLPMEKVIVLVNAVLREMKKVFDFNRAHRGQIEVGFDGQISNWAIVGFNPEHPLLDEPVELLYFDTSTPLMRRNDEEQMDPELFLRSAPSFLVWILRLLFLEDVMTRYYDFRRVAVDLIANFYKEQCAEWVPELTHTVNDFLRAADLGEDFEAITVREVEKYYREDAMIWRLYLSFRKVDRFFRTLLGADYPYVLPEKIQR